MFSSNIEIFTDWFVTSKMIKRLFTALYADENILYFNNDSGNFVSNSNEIVMKLVRIMLET